MQGYIRTFVIALIVVMFSAPAWAKGRLVVYCSNEAFACQAVADAFSKKYDVKVQMTRAGSGSTYAKILAEKDNPKDGLEQDVECLFFTCHKLGHVLIPEC